MKPRPLFASLLFALTALAAGCNMERDGIDWCFTTDAEGCPPPGEPQRPIAPQQ